MTPESLSKIRHEIRTLLNHIVGYTEILLEDSLARKESELQATFRDLQELVLHLQKPVHSLFSESSEAEDPEAGRRRVYSLLYDIIALLQTAKRQCATKEQKESLPDIQKVLNAANSTVELIENSLVVLPNDRREVKTPALEEDAETAQLTGKILVVDDDSFNREILTRHLERQGHTVVQASDGIQALETLKKEPFDLVFLDVMMPGMNGYKVLERIKAMSEFGDIPVIVVSALEESGSVARCLRLGAEDYLPREFDPLVLRARIESSLERKRLRTREELSIRALRETQRRLASELARAAEYVRGLLPRRVRWKELQTDWLFLPSLDLGGDAFGYKRLDNGDISFYLVDVSGHGIEAALLSVSLINRIQTQPSSNPTLWDPAFMLSRFNRFFRSEEQNSLYFTAWFGLWNPETRIIRYAGAGSPPAVLADSEGSTTLLNTENPAVGIDEDAAFSFAEETVPPSARLYVFSDGIFETRRREESILGLPGFLDILRSEAGGPIPGNLTRIVDSVRSLLERRTFDDDVSLLGVYFDA